MREIRPRLLCIDDEPNIVQSLERLTKGQFEFTGLTDPQKGLDLLAAHDDFAVVISDYRMPQLNGVEFFKQARKLSPLTARVLLSGQIDLNQISEAINHADIHKFLMKPWDNEYLLLQLLETLQTHRTLNERDHYLRLAMTDPVTELTNHRYFQDRVRLEIERSQASGDPVSLAIFDVDRFKQFNDQYGHPEGDRLLYAIAGRLRALGKDHGLVSRYGGEEFTLILPGLDSQAAVALVARILKDFSDTPLPGPSSSSTRITLSAGVAAYPEHAPTAPEIIESADRALYRAKNAGRNQVSK